MARSETIFNLPAELYKSDDTEEMRIRGYASTPAIDREGESIIQEGLDIEPFKEYGFFNYNHDNSFIVGYPDKDRTGIDKNGFYTEGNLLPNQIGKRVWDTAIALKKSNAPRQMGMSVEGEVLKRDKKGNIIKARIHNVAITPTPVNPNATWEAVVKSMTTASKSLNTKSGSALIPESLDGIKRWLGYVEDGDQEAIEAFNVVKSSLDESSDKESIKTYLMLFEGYYGDDLEDKANQILELMEEKDL